MNLNIHTIPKLDVVVENVERIFCYIIEQRCNKNEQL